MFDRKLKEFSKTFILWTLLILWTTEGSAAGGEDRTVESVNKWLSNNIIPATIIQDSIDFPNGDKGYISPTSDLESDSYFFRCRKDSLLEVDYLTMSPKVKADFIKQFLFKKSRILINDPDNYKRVDYYLSKDEKLSLEIWSNEDQVIELRFFKKK